MSNSGSDEMPELEGASDDDGIEYEVIKYTNQGG